MKRPDMPNRKCAGLVDLFFMEAYSRAKEVEAKQICMSCEHIDECLAYSLHHEEFGIWGGLNMKQRMVLRKELGITLERPENEALEDMRILSMQRLKYYRLGHATR